MPPATTTTNDEFPDYQTMSDGPLPSPVASTVLSSSDKNLSARRRRFAAIIVVALGLLAACIMDIVSLVNPTWFSASGFNTVVGPSVVFRGVRIGESRTCVTLEYTNASAATGAYTVTNCFEYDIDDNIFGTKSVQDVRTGEWVTLPHFCSGDRRAVAASIGIPKEVRVVAVWDELCKSLGLLRGSIVWLGVFACIFGFCTLCALVLSSANRSTLVPSMALAAAATLCGWIGLGLLRSIGHGLDFQRGWGQQTRLVSAIIYTVGLVFAISNYRVGIREFDMEERMEEEERRQAQERRRQEKEARRLEMEENRRKKMEKRGKKYKNPV